VQVLRPRSWSFFRRLALNVFFRRRCSLSFFISFKSAAGRGGAARLLQQHEPYEAHHFGLCKQVDEQPAQADRLAAQFGSRVPAE
jgi:hypothetical protein